MAAIAQTFRPGAATVPATQVEISVSCRKLRDRDVMSKSDPICVVFTKQLGKNNYNEFGRTEMIKDTLNPDFVKKVVMQYFFEESQKLKFEVYDVDSPSSRLDRQDFLGGMECTLGEIVGAPGNRIDKPLKDRNYNCGTITVRADEVSSCKDVATMQFSGQKLDKKDLFGKSDPYLKFYRSNEDGSYTVVHKTEVIKNTLNPTWRPFIIPVRSLCNGDYDRPIKVECYDWDSDGGHDFIGDFIVTMKQLSQGGGSSDVFECINKKKKAKKKSYKNSGTITCMSCRIEQQHSFLDFITGGTELNFTVAIDFTASNGDPNQPNSLHYMNPYQPSQYARAIQAVGEIIQDYDHDKMFPALGFGARLPPDGRVSHEFFLNGNPQNPHCAGIHGILQAYHQTLQSVQLYGPTNFAPVIHHMARFATAYQTGTHYFVLLIITDGVITDMPQTKEAIVQASGLPMSIIIVGVGPADFAAMDELDSDDKRLSSQGRYAERDIVQFVPFRDFLGGKYGSDPTVAQAYLAKEVLAEVPDQITGWMKRRGVQPKPAPPPTSTGSSTATSNSYGYTPVSSNGSAPGAGGGSMRQAPPPPTGGQPGVHGYAPPPAQAPPQAGYQAPRYAPPPAGQVPPAAPSQGGYQAPGYGPPQTGQAPPPPAYSGQAAQAPPYPGQPGHAPYPGQAPYPTSQYPTQGGYQQQVSQQASAPPPRW